MDYYTTSPEEKTYLRELARKQLEYAHLPEMAERKKAWFAHNRVEGYRTMVVMEENSFWSDVKPAARCTNGAARWLEAQLQQHIFVHEMIGDDKVVPDTVSIPMKIGFLPFGLSPNRKNVEGGIGYHIEPVINELTADLPKLGPSVFTYNAEGTDQLKTWASELVGDILPPRVINTANHWAFGATQRVVDFMGMESMLISMMDEPEAFHQFMQMIADDLIRFLRWQEQNGLLLLNNGNDYMGSGSFCFSDELPQADFAGQVRSIDTWGHVNSQETVGISPSMYHEFIRPYFVQLASQFGLVYYGCCEPVDSIWEDSVSRLPNLRKVSISPWCNEPYMAERLAGSKVIYSRKPSPNFIGIEAAFDATAFSRHIQQTVDLTQNCTREFIFRDIYSMNGNLDKMRQAVSIVRSLAT